MNKSFSTFCEVYSENILSELENEIESLNLPKYVQNRLLDVLIECEGEIIEHYFEQIISEFEDNSYEEFKESRLNIN